MTATSSGPRDLVLRYIRGLQDRDVETLTEILADDVELWASGDHPASGTWTGLEKVAVYFGIFGARFDPEAPFVIEVRSIVTEGDQVAVEWTSSTTTRDGHPFRNDIAAFFTVANGQIINIREHTDTAHAARTIFADAG